MKQKRVRSFLAFLLACCMLVGSLAGCGNSTNTESSASTTAASGSNTTTAADSTAAPTEAESTEPESTEPITITIGVSSLGNGWPTNVEDDFMRDAIFEATNVWVDFIRIDEYYTSLNIQLTGGTAPDFFYADYKNMVQYAAQGLIQDIGEYKDDIAPVFEYLGEEYDNFTLYVDDAMYAFPKAAADTDLYYGYYVRQDILDKYGLEAPSTVDELFDFCQKAVQDDITNLGTIGLSGKNMWTYNLLAAAYGVEFGNYIIIKDGKVTNTLLDENMKAALTEVKRFYDAGLISPNTFNGGSGTTEMRQGQAVAGVSQWASLMKQAYLDVFHEVVPDGEWVLVQPLESEVEGVESFVGHVDYNSNGCTKVVVNSETPEEKINAFIKVINYLSSEAGMLLSWLGIQGTHWDYDADGNAVVIEGQAEAINYISTYQIIGRNDPVYLSVKFPEATEVMEYNNTLARLVKYNNTLEVPETFYLDDLNTYVEAQMLAFIKGDRPIDDYDNFIQELYNIYDLQTYLDIATEQLTEMGLLN